MTGGGPLAGVKVIELGGIGPGPHAGMVLADLGADVVRVRRPGGLTMPSEDRDLMHRGKRIVDLDVKTQPEALLELAAKADVLLDCFRPGTCERLGIGPDDCAAVNPRLIFARITGWGQDGPLASTAGHDINYLSQTGALSALGYADRPPMPPLNLVADFGGGSMLVLLGIVAALVRAGTLGQGPGHRRRDGRRGQRARPDDVDHEVDRRAARSSANRSCSTAAPRSTVAMRPPTASTWRSALSSRSSSRRCWPGSACHPAMCRASSTSRSYRQMHDVFAERFAGRTRAEWTAVFAGTDACVTPVLTWTEAAANEHLNARSTVITAHGAEQAAPAPRFSRTPAGPVGPPPAATTPFTEIDW